MLMWLPRSSASSSKACMSVSAWATINLYANDQPLGVLPSYAFSVADIGGSKIDPAKRNVRDFTLAPARLYVVSLPPVTK